MLIGEEVASGKRVIVAYSTLLLVFIIVPVSAYVTPPLIDSNNLVTYFNFDQDAVYKEYTFDDSAQGAEWYIDPPYYKEYTVQGYITATGHTKRDTSTTDEIYLFTETVSPTEESISATAYKTFNSELVTKISMSLDMYAETHDYHILADAKTIINGITVKEVKCYPTMQPYDCVNTYSGNYTYTNIINIDTLKFWTYAAQTYSTTKSYIHADNIRIYTPSGLGIPKGSFSSQPFSNRAIYLSSGAYIDPKTPIIAPYAGSFTYSMWVKCSQTSGRLTLYSESSTSNSAKRIIEIYNNNLRFLEYSNTGALLTNVKGTAPVCTGDWKLITVAADSSKVYLYVDAKSDAQGSRGSGATSISVNKAYIGALFSSGSLTNYYTGDLDEVRVYKTTFTLNKVRKLAAMFIVKTYNEETLSLAKIASTTTATPIKADGTTYNTVKQTAQDYLMDFFYNLQDGAYYLTIQDPNYYERHVRVTVDQNAPNTYYSIYLLPKSVTATATTLVVNDVYNQYSGEFYYTITRVIDGKEYFIDSYFFDTSKKASTTLKPQTQYIVRLYCNGELLASATITPNGDTFTYTFVLDKAPNLKITDFSAPATVSYPESIGISITVSNVGDLATKTSTSLRVKVDGTTIQTFSVPTLSAGGSQSFYLTWTPSNYGSYTITAEVDPLDSITEKNENDNTATVSVTVYAAELTITGVQFSSPVLYNGQNTATVTIQNAGNLQAQNVKVSLKANGVEVGSATATIGTGTTANVQVVWTPQTTGSTNILIVVDPENSIAEPNEGNNELSTQVTVNYVDLNITNIILPSGTIAPGKEYGLDVYISNEGDYPSGTIQVILQDNEVVADSESVSISPGATAKVTLQWTPNGLGDHQLVISVNPGELVPELSYSNNEYIKVFTVKAAELVLKDVQIPDNVAMGKQIIISATVENTGNLDASTDITLLEGSTAVTSISKTFPAGGNESISLAYTPSGYGSFQVTLCVDYNNLYEELDENNNCYIAVVSSKAPNLKVSLDMPSMVELTSDGVPVNITVTNNGNYNASAFTVLIDYSYEQKTERIEFLASGESVNIKTNLSLPIGYHTIMVVVDPGDEVKESNEDDNSISQTITVSGADLAIKSVTMPETIQLNETAEITVETENRGIISYDSYYLLLKVNGETVQNVTATTSIITLQWTANETGTFSIEIEVQPIGVYDADLFNNKVTETLKVTAPDLYLSVVAPEIVDAQSSFTISISIKNQGDGLASGFSLIARYADQIQTKQGLNCDPGKTLTYTFTFTASKNETYLYVKVDPDDIIQESDEQNNEFNRSILVRVPDLRVSINAPSDAPVNEKQTIQVTVRNIGEIKGTGKVSVLVDNTTILSKTVTVEPKKTTSLTAYYTATKDKYTEGSSFTITAKVETDFGTDTKIAIVRVVAPDLTVNSIEIPAEVVLGEETYVTVKVKNTGDHKAGAFTLKLQCGGTTIGTATFESLSAGASVAKSFKWTPQQLGTYTFEAIVDPENKVVEWNESNNKQTQTAVRAPDLTITSVSTNETEFYVYSPYKVKVTVANIGSAAAENIKVNMEYTNNTKSMTIGKLYPGNSTSVILFFTPTSNGTIQVNVSVDPLNTIMETDEDNNVYLVDFLVKDPPRDINLSSAQLPESMQEKATMTLSWSMFGGYFMCAGAIVYGIAQFATTGGVYGRKFILLGIIGAIILTSLNSAIGSI